SSAGKRAAPSPPLTSARARAPQVRNPVASRSGTSWISASLNRRAKEYSRAHARLLSRIGKGAGSRANQCARRVHYPCRTEIGYDRQDGADWRLLLYGIRVIRRDRSWLL